MDLTVLCSVFLIMMPLMDTILVIALLEQGYAGTAGRMLIITVKMVSEAKWGILFLFILLQLLVTWSVSHQVVCVLLMGSVFVVLAGLEANVRYLSVLKGVIL